MILDIVLAGIILIFGLWGLKRGTLFTFMHTAGWIIYLVLAFMATPYIKSYLNKNTELAKVFIPSRGFVGGVPKILGDEINSLTSQAIFTVVIFAALTLALRILLGILLHLYTKKQKGTFVGFLDASGGFLLGLLKGCFVVLFVLIILIPFAGLLSPDLANSFSQELKISYISHIVYDNNPLWLILQNFLA